MISVRKDVMKKLDTGLDSSKKYAIEHGASIPKTYHYSTRKATHYIWEDKGTRYYNSTLYDGTKAHSEKGVTQ